jgi:hypothetical protein
LNVTAEPRSLAFDGDGAQLFRGVAADCVDELRGAFAGAAAGRAGARLASLSSAQHTLSVTGPIGGVAASLFGRDAKPVRALLLDKSADTNWSLDWHQDRTICVKRRLDAPGFGPWTVKAGRHHVAPPLDLLSGMITLRVHLDDAGPDNGPLLIAPGSHRLGRISEGDIEEAVNRCGIYVCLAELGDVWAYSTPILHASKAARFPSRRRVLQIDYAADELPFGLEWHDLI